MPVDNGVIAENTDISLITKEENRAFKISFIVFILMLVLLVALIIPKNSLFRSPSGELTTQNATIMQSIVPIIFLLLVIP